VGARGQRRRLGQGRVEPVEAAPQRAGYLRHRDGAAVLGQRHFEVRAADVIAGCDGHGSLASASRIPARLLTSRAVLHKVRVEASDPMDVIPVIDVRYGLAVAAVRGERADYRPLVTPLAAGSDPADVARGYAALFTFPVLYVADLDGIEGRGRSEGLPAHLAAAVPGMRLWIDDGTPARAAARRI